MEASAFRRAIRSEPSRCRRPRSNWIKLCPNSKVTLLTNPRNIVRLPIDSVRPSPHHARVHNRKKRRKLEKLLQRFGQVAPIIVDQDHVIVDGHASPCGSEESGLA